MSLCSDELRPKVPAPKFSAQRKELGSVKIEDLLLLRFTLSDIPGVGFNPDGDYKIDCDDDQWEAIVQADKDAKFTRNKSWPFWETWKVIFGKDRACGGGAEGVANAAEPPGKSCYALPRSPPVQ
ncbi:hypothetical protein SASPL_123469 [Salvia splendens]|uniref:Uncharacterized protein n=1 Tax=Salvia splendens TaxID=180675 RepID=A0A8X8XNM1_SALSN|nr:hypothetical protein SASPL_123469 [Salvia splendens]